MINETIDLGVGQKFFLKKENNFAKCMTYERVGIICIAPGDGTLPPHEFIYENINSSVNRGFLEDVERNLNQKDIEMLHTKFKIDENRYHDIISVLARYKNMIEPKYWDLQTIPTYQRELETKKTRFDAGKRLIGLLGLDTYDIMKTMEMHDTDRLFEIQKYLEETKEE